MSGHVKTSQGPQKILDPRGLNGSYNGTCTFSS